MRSFATKFRKAEVGEYGEEIIINHRETQSSTCHNS